MSTWICSDLHGYYDVYEQINKIIESKDIVEFLGDAIDRGPYSFELMKAIRYNPNWVYYRGNHEIMLADALKFTGSDINFNYAFCLANGASYHGEKTTYDYIREEGSADEWIYYLENETYLWGMMKNKSNYHIHLSHAGVSNPLEMKKVTDYDLYWDRSHIYEDVPRNCFNHLVIHGHTPLPLFEQLLQNGFKDDVLKFYQPHKLCIDAGTYMTGYTYLVNFDTLTPNNIDYKIITTKEVPYASQN